MSVLLPLIVFLVIAIFVLIVTVKYIAPAVPAPWGGVLIAVVALILILVGLWKFGFLPG